jgi:heat shock transcription factor, other eukaryote
MAISDEEFLRWGDANLPAQKRRQIPPFVQKLASFLENGKNTDLIRWSEHGNSFIVLDEDEFARTLIPELFKHNNYASFVRQLNMYGFHKKVGLSDNSMRASERKNKTPSEYANLYFRRGHPELLWMITKPKNATTKKGKKADTDTLDEDVEEVVDDDQSTDTRVRTRPQLSLTQGEDNSLSQVSKEQFVNINQQLQTIKNQQVQIQRTMAQLRQNQESLYGQAATFQDQHTRHENSINAILTFLATVYNRSLQGHEGMQGIQNLFAGAMPTDQHSGTVVDVGDYTFDNLASADASPGKPFKKPPLLITDGSQQGRASTMSPSTAGTPMRAQYRPSQVEEILDSSETPMPTSQDIMNVIQTSNARNSPGTTTDFSNMISDLQNSGGSNPLNSSQRADMLRLINNTSGNGTTGDNALINTNPPPGPTNFDHELASNQATYDSLAKMQAEQDKSVQNLTNLLQPLSPSGSIPGIHDDTKFDTFDWNNPAYFDFGNENESPKLQLDDYDDMFGTVPTDDTVPTTTSTVPTTTSTVPFPSDKRRRTGSSSSEKREYSKRRRPASD